MVCGWLLRAGDRRGLPEIRCKESALMYRILRIALLVSSAGYWMILLSWILVCCYLLFGGLGLAYWLLAWPALLLLVISGLLSYIGFYAIGVVLFLAALAVSVVTRKGEIIRPTSIYLLSALIALAVEWLGVMANMDFLRMLRSTFVPWFG